MARSVYLACLQFLVTSQLPERVEVGTLGNGADVWRRLRTAQRYKMVIGYAHGTARRTNASG